MRSSPRRYLTLTRAEIIRGSTADRPPFESLRGQVIFPIEIEDGDDNLHLAARVPYPARLINTPAKRTDLISLEDVRVLLGADFATLSFI